jgi:hypothetical protein
MPALKDPITGGRENLRRMTMGDDLLMLRNGKMLILKDHELVAMQEEMLLVDGTRIALDGRVILSDGTFQALVEGQSILIDSRGMAA